MLMGMVALILVIACGNVAMLLIARNSSRTREFSVRIALGGSRGQILRQLLTESLVLVAAGAFLGWLFAQWATNVLARWSELQTSLAPDHSVLLFTIAISVAAGLLFGLAPLRNATNAPMALALKNSALSSQPDGCCERYRISVVPIWDSGPPACWFSALIRRPASKAINRWRNSIRTSSSACATFPKWNQQR